MSSHPSGLRFSTFAQPSPQKGQQQTKSGVNTGPDDLIVVRPGSAVMASTNSSVDGASVMAARAISEARNPLFNASNRSSLKEPNSNRSSMDVSTCSYNTLIIHNDDGLYSSGADYGGNATKKDRPRSFGTDQVIKEILETPDYNQNSVLKQLVKEMKLPSHRSSSRDQGEIEMVRPPPKYGMALSADRAEIDHDVGAERTGEDKEGESGDQATLSKMKSKSQPDLSRIIDIDLETIEALMKDNMLLKEQLNHCYKKVAKTKKLEEEVTNIYRVHEELVQSCERREKLERAARTRLQSDVQRLQEANNSLKEEVDIYQSQLLAPSEHQMVIAQLFQQNKELTSAKERQDIELAAQRATLQEQRKHIGILDKALQNAQHNSRCLEEELRKKKKTYSGDALKDSNLSGSSTNSAETKWIVDQTSQLMSRLDIDCSKLEQRRMDEVAYRQNLAKSIEKTSQESQRMLDEARQEKMRYLEEFHLAQKKVSDLQSHLKELENRCALIRALEIPKECGSSFDSWPLNASNASFNTSMDQNYGPSNNHMSSSSSSLLPNSEAAANYSMYMRSGDVGANFISSKLNTNSPSSSPSLNYGAPGASALTDQQILLAGHHHRPSYSPKPSSMGGYENRALTAQPMNYNGLLLDSQERAQLGLMTRKSMEDHLIKKEFDAQMNKRGLCCFPNLIAKKPVVMTQTANNSSDVFLHKLAQDMRSRQDKQMQPQLELPSRPDDIVLLERQGRSSQRMRSSEIGNMGTNTPSSVATTIPRLASTPSMQFDKRGASLPPPRNLKPPRKTFGFTSSLSRKEEPINNVDFNAPNKVAGSMRDQPSFMQHISGATYQRLSPTKKRSLLPTPSGRSSRPLGHTSHQYMPIGRSPSPARHAHFILGRTPTPTPPMQKNGSKCTRNC